MVVRWKIWFLFLLLLFAGSYLREVTFLSINAIIKGETQFYAKTIEISFLQNYSPAFLTKLKVILTALFSFLFILLSTLGLKLSFKQKYPHQLALFIYGILGLIGGITLFSYFFDFSFETIYLLLRTLIGWIHNPLLYILLSIASFSAEVLKKTEN
ncbi:MAG: hypothetical protein RIB02_12365 [Vicingaceae bacterium]